MPILPDQFEQLSALAILRDLEMGLVGFDHRLIRRLLATPEETVEAVVTLAEAPGDDRVVELDEQIFDLFRCLNTPRPRSSMSAASVSAMMPACPTN